MELTNIPETAFKLTRSIYACVGRVIMGSLEKMDDKMDWQKGQEFIDDIGLNKEPPQ